MPFHNHVFISYAHNDNVETSGKGWVSRSHELLEAFLTSRLKRAQAVIWRDKRLTGNDVFDPAIMRELPNSAGFVAVVPDNYDGGWCRREVDGFCEAANRSVWHRGTSRASSRS